MPLHDDKAGRLSDRAWGRYYFLTEVHPAAGGRELLRTPNWLKRQVLAAGFGQVCLSAANQRLCLNRKRLAKTCSQTQLGRR